MPSYAAIAPIAQHRGREPQLACDLDQRPTAARQQGDRLRLELIRKITPFLAHSTPSRSRRSLAKVSTNSGEAQFRLIEDQRDIWPVRVMCDALSVSPSGFYAWRSRPESARKIANRELLVDIRRVHADHRGRYGAPRIHAELRAEGHIVSRKRIERVMHRHGIRAHAPRRYRVCTTDSKHALPIAANLLDRNFVAEKPDQIWLADIAYIPTGEGWLYLAVILDLFTRKVVGWAMREHMRAELTMAALTMAIQRRRPGPGLVHHSDRGSQYAAGNYRKILQAAAITQSMSRKGNCWDNAPMESFFGTLKTELVHQCDYPDRDAARRDLFAYIEGYYNRRRIHSALGYITGSRQPENRLNPVSTVPGEGHACNRAVSHQAHRQSQTANSDRQRCPTSASWWAV